MSDGNYWAVITAPLLESDAVSDGAKLFYCEISRRTNQRGYCWASNESLASELRLGERTISRYVAELEAAGFITTELVGVSDRKRRTERRIRLAVPTPFEVAKNGETSVAKNGESSVAKNGEPNVAKNGEAIDSYNINNNLGIERKNNPPITPQRDKRVPERAKWKPDRFEKFWEYYRTNVNPANRAAARKAWDKLKPDDETITAIGRALKVRLQTDEEWRRGIGRPHASTYLNGQQWLDTGPTKPKPKPEEGESKEAFGVWT